MPDAASPAAGATEDTPLVKSSGDGQIESAASRRSRLMTTLNVTAASLTYMSFGPLLILANSHILNQLSFKFPLFVTAQGMLFTGVVSSIVVAYRGSSRQVTWKFYWQRCGLVGCFSALAMGIGNASYMYLTVSLVNMLKSLSPLTVALVLAALGIETKSAMQWGVLAVICVANGSTYITAPEFPVIGVILLMTGDMLEATRTAITQSLMREHKFSVLEAGYYLAPISAVFLLAASAVLEVPGMTSGGHLETISSHWPIFALSACLGLFVNFAGFWCIQAVGGVVLKMLGMVRTTMLIIFCVVVLGEESTTAQLLSYCVSMLAFGVYVFLPQIQTQLQKMQTAPAAVTEVKTEAKQGSTAV